MIEDDIVFDENWYGRLIEANNSVPEYDRPYMFRLNGLGLFLHEGWENKIKDFILIIFLTLFLSIINAGI